MYSREKQQFAGLGTTSGLLLSLVSVQVFIYFIILVSIHNFHYELIDCAFGLVCLTVFLLAGNKCCQISSRSLILSDQMRVIASCIYCSEPDMKTRIAAPDGGLASLLVCLKLIGWVGGKQLQYFILKI